MKIGWVLCGPDHIGTARISGTNLVNELKRQKVDASIIHQPEFPTLNMPHIEERLEGKNYDLIVFQKRGGPGFISAMKYCREHRIKTVYNCGDYIEAALVYAKLCDAQVSPSKHMCKLLGRTWKFIPSGFETFSGHYVHKDEGARPFWFGNASNKEPLDKLVPFICTTISNFAGCTVEWSLDVMNRLYEFGNVSVLPQSNSAWGVSKGEGRAVQSKAMGFPVIATPIPAYRKLPGIMFAVTPQDWQDRLEELNNPETRLKWSREGRTEIEMKYNIEQIALRWMALFFSLLGSQQATNET